MKNQDAMVVEYGPVYYILPYTLFYLWGRVYFYYPEANITITADGDWREIEEQLFATSQGWV